MNVTDQIARLWQQLLDVVSQFVIPDWAALVNLLPIFLVVGVLGPIATIVAIGWIAHFRRRPAARIPDRPDEASPPSRAAAA